MTDWTCSTCATPLQEAAQGIPCPNCGGTARTAHVTISETVGVAVSHRIQMKSPSHKKKLRIDEISGWGFNRTLGRLVRIFQRMDRDNDTYDKVVIDPVTGDVLKDQHEPLSQHQGRGDAKPKE